MATKEHKGPQLIIKRVKDISFFVNESIYVPDPAKIVKIEMNQTFGTNINLNLANFTLRVFFHYQDDPIEAVLGDIQVQNIFEIPDLKSFVKDDASSFPNEILVSMVSLSISHARALLAKNLAGTVYQEVVLPITNPIDATNHFFPRNVSPALPKEEAKKR